MEELYKKPYAPEAVQDKPMWSANKPCSPEAIRDQLLWSAHQVIDPELRKKIAVDIGLRFKNGNVTTKEISPEHSVVIFNYNTNNREAVNEVVELFGNNQMIKHFGLSCGEFQYNKNLWNDGKLPKMVKKFNGGFSFWIDTDSFHNWYQIILPII